MSLSIRHHPLCPVREDTEVDVVALADVGEGIGGLGVPTVKEPPGLVFDDVDHWMLGVRIVGRFDIDLNDPTLIVSCSVTVTSWSGATP